MTEFVQNDAKKDQQDKHHAIDGGCASAVPIEDEPKPGEKQEECSVDLNVYACDMCEMERPAHDQRCSDGGDKDQRINQHGNGAPAHSDSAIAGSDEEILLRCTISRIAMC